MPTLDRSHPYGEVWGAGLQGYEQDGRMYRLDGEPFEPEPAKPKAGKPGKIAAAAEQPPASGTPPEPALPSAPPDFAEKSDEELRALVDIAGGEWTDRAAAIAFLTEA